MGASYIPCSFQSIDGSTLKTRENGHHCIVIAKSTRFLGDDNKTMQEDGSLFDRTFPQNLTGHPVADGIELRDHPQDVGRQFLLVFATPVLIGKLLRVNGTEDVEFHQRQLPGYFRGVDTLQYDLFRFFQLHEKRVRKEKREEREEKRERREGHTFLGM